MIDMAEDNSKPLSKDHVNAHWR